MDKFYVVLVSNYGHIALDEPSHVLAVFESKDDADKRAVRATKLHEDAKAFVVQGIENAKKYATSDCDYCLHVLA